MPHEGYITKQDLENYERQMRNLAENEEEDPLFHNQQGKRYEGEEWKTYLKLQNDTDRLSRNKRTGYFSSKKIDDSGMMKEVKQALHDVTRFYLETPMASTEGEFEEQLSQIQQYYQALKEKCGIYLANKKGGIKRIYRGEGYQRYQLVKNALTKAQVEMAVLESRAKQVFEAFANEENEQERPLWVNALAEARTRRINLNNPNVGQIEYTGGNTSNIIKLTAQSGEVAYIKKNEKNLPIEYKIGSFISNYMDSGTAKAMINEGVSAEELKVLISFLGNCFCYNAAIRHSFMESDNLNAQHFENGQIKASHIKKAFPKAGVQIPDNLQHIFQKERVANQVIKDFGTYFYRNNMAYGLATGVAKMDENSSITDRNVATYRLAELLGLSELIPATTKVIVTAQDENEQKGILMAEARGKELWEANRNVDAKDASYDKGLYLQMNSLQIMDIIAGQTDRHNANMLLESEGDHFKKLKGIDNDLCFGKITYKEIVTNKTGSDDVKSLEDENGIKIKFIDKKVYDRVLALNDEIIRYTLADLLTDGEMKALLDRLHGVQKLFRRIKPADNVKICTQEEFSDRDAFTAKYYQNGCYTSLMK